MRISLISFDGGEPLPITLPLTLVGRKEDCDIRLEGEGVADLLCVLAQIDNLLLVRDLDTDTIRVNGQLVRRAILLPNAHLTMANHRFRVQYDEPAESTSSD
jgi:hypothetical protein